MATIFPLSASVGQVFDGYEFDGTSWNIIGIDLTANYALDSELTAHEVDTTNVHGIADTSLLVVKSELSSASAQSISSASALAYASASAYTDSSISNLIDAAPSALNTLNELAAALNDDSNFATTVTNSLAGKQSASSAMVVVDNGADSNFARPTGVGAVYWIGSASPSNAAEYDMWWSG